MPIYEYRREDGTTFDLIQKFSDDALTVDPETGQKVVRVLHSPAVHFKGSGFYNTDYGTRKRKRELEKSADSGANDWPDKKKDKDKAAAGGSSGSSGSSGSNSSASSSDGASKSSTPAKSSKSE